MNLRLRLLGIWGAVVLFAALLAAWTWFGYRDAESRMLQSVRNHARLLAEHASGVFTAADLLLRAVADDARLRKLTHTNHDGLSAEDKQAMERQLVQLSRALPGAVNLFVIDAQGKVVLAAVPVRQDARLSDLDYFRQLASTRTSASVIGTTVLGQGSGKWAVPIARRIENERGEFIGVIGLSLGIDAQFSNFYAGVDWPPGTAISLWSAQHTLLMRFPMLSKQIGKPTSGKLLGTSRLAGSTEGVEIGPSEFDGRIRARAMHAMDRFPVAAIVAIPPEGYFAAWRTTMLSAAIALGAVVLAAFMSTLLVVRRNRSAQRRAQEQAQHAAELEAYGLIIQASPTALALLTPTLECRIANAALADMLGCTECSPVGAKLMTLFPDPAREQVLRDVQASLGGQYRKSRIRLPGNEGERVLALESSPQFQGEEIVGALLSLRDVTAEAHAQASLLEREAELRAIFDCEPDCVKVFGLDGRLRRINQAGVRSLEADDLNHALATRLTDLIDLGDREHFENFIADVRAGRSGSLRFHGHGLKGTPRVVEMHAAPLRDERNVIVGVLSISRDVTHLAEVESRLRAVTADEARLGWLQSVLDQCPAGVMVTDTEARIEYVNDEFTRITGYSREQAIGKDPGFAKSGSTPAQTYASLWEALSSGRSWHGTFFNRRSNGEEYVARQAIAPVRAGDGRITHYVGVEADITEQRRIDAELRAYQQVLERRVTERSEEYQALYNQAPCGYFSFTSDGRVSAINDTALGLLGYRRDDVLQQLRLRDLFARHETERYEACCKVLMQNGTAHDQDFDLLRKDGTVLAARISAEVELDARGKIVGARATFEDNRERRARERQISMLNLELKQRADELAQASEAKSTFLASMSHELRTPLNAIIGLSHVLRRTRLSDKQLRHIDHIEAAGGHLLKVISGILDISRIEAGKLMLEREAFRIDDLLPRVLALVEQAALAKGLAIVTDAPPLDGRVQGDATRLVQALLNLAGNAVKFTEHGTVTLRMRVVHDGPRQLALRFEVEDTGCGIDPAVLPGLFVPFRQADQSITRKHGGTGLGLAITRQLAELMGGTTGAASEPGRGSRFWFTAQLDKVVDEAVRPSESGNGPRVDTPTEPADASIGRGRRILVVEDEPTNQLVTKELLVEAGFTVDIANNGAEALTMAPTGDYALILMDLQMPQMDGLTATRQLREVPALRETPIVALTANALADDEARCLDAGMNAFLSKPIEPDLLVATVARWCKAEQNR